MSLSLRAQRILLTGAAGGIGRELARELASRGARLGLLGRTDASVASLEHLVATQRMDAVVIQADLTDAAARRAAVARMTQAYGGLDVLINLAGVLDFRFFDEVDPAMITRALQVNVEAPMQMVREVLPDLLDRGTGRIVNVGSTFGSIGYAGFAAYSASKFALRGFSQALRRELDGTGVGVTYVAPRAVRTAFNPPAVHLMAEKKMMHMDEPAWVASSIVRAIERERSEAYLGFPESLFARINGVLPSMVDNALRKVLPDLARHARSTV
ncbi:SDR family oxidoreductase [Luteibacter sp. PPL201]|jgi:short-subunit dehydrogenase|uniref:SDR family oxidoreductase n=1 Tax=Luteibacter sahnii TaxID=3021977 RepID=A0ABT6BEI3_9GAMM|nr:SDR family oxidoreductase [Luteibacter sp. PPL193]MDY1549812.1 SDR family oxidoreductase [Luteibacter sp. PPL193]